MNITQKIEDWRKNGVLGRRVAGVAIIAVISSVGICNASLCLHERHVELKEKEALDVSACAATDYLQECARAGDCHAQYELGERLFRGDRVAPDCDRAILWLLASAEQGYKPACTAALAIRDNYRGPAEPIWERDAVVGCPKKRLEKLRYGDEGPNGRFVRFVRQTDRLIRRQAQGAVAASRAEED